jgi:hypothetical protein
MSEVEIRRIREPEGAAVVQLWDRMCREIVDGGPLTPQGRDHLRRMLEAAAWHRGTFCLVAVLDGEVTGFAVGRVDTGDGLLPGAVGQLEELWAEPGPDRDAVKRALAEAAIARLRAAGRPGRCARRWTPGTRPSRSSGGRSASSPTWW